jgi:TonB family protein
MRRILVATLVLIPVLARAQASTSTEQPIQAAATLVAKANPPAPIAPAKSAAPATSSVAGEATLLPVHMVIHQITSDDEFSSDALQHGGTISHSFGNDLDNGLTSPELIHVVQADLAPRQLAQGSDVTVRLTVDTHGVPHNIQVIKASDTEVAQKTIAAVSQYRFKPATRDYLAVPEDISINVKIK